ncbi:MAG: RNA polymerase sigma factor [Acidimicrobiales bacterium]
MTIGEGFSRVLARARQGEQASIVTLYQDVTPPLIRYLRAREPREAEDLCSEIWLKLAELIPTFEGTERQWWGLVFLVARRALNDYWKRQRRRATDPVATEALADFPGTSDVEAAGLQSVTTAEAIAVVRSALSDEQADVILLRTVAGLDIDEVAAAMGKRPATIRVIQHRALRRLAGRLATTSRPERDQDHGAARPILATGEGGSSS